MEEKNISINHKATYDLDLDNVLEIINAPTTGDKIRAARKQKGKSAEWLGKQIGCSQSTISQYERNVRFPMPRILNAIAKALGVHAYELYTTDYTNEYKVNSMIGEDGESVFASYLKNYDINEEEYIRFSISFEKLTLDARRKALEYIEDLSRIPEYTFLDS